MKQLLTKRKKNNPKKPANEDSNHVFKQYKSPKAKQSVPKMEMKLENETEVNFKVMNMKAQED